jgi:Helicase conserved C-terminal domain
LKRAFNEPPDRQPLRILIATDAAREGLNLQAHCWNLFHYDLPWNPSRLEQRNGRIDRKLQPNGEVFCHYFVYTQRPEDRVLAALVRKTETIRLELGSLSEVIEKRLRTGIRRAESESAAAEIEALEDDPAKRAARQEELDDAAKVRQKRLRDEVETLTNRINDARKWIGLDETQLRDALNCSLNYLQTEPLKECAAVAGEPTRYIFPNLQARHGGDPRWAATLDTLRPPPDHDQSLYEWRREAPLRPVIFSPPPGFDGDTVQLHLSHRVVQRLLGRFLAQGFVYHDLSRACLAQADDNIARVVLLGRLAIYGAGAVRLHEELVTVTARWTPPAERKTPLSPYARDAEARTMGILQESLKTNAAARTIPADATKLLQSSVAQDIRELLPHLEERGQSARADAEKQLVERGQAESLSLKTILEDQRRRVLAKYNATDANQLILGFSDEEKRQLFADRRHWERWLANVEGDLVNEPKRIAEFYKTKSFRLEPVGLAYLWPVTK